MKHNLYTVLMTGLIWSLTVAVWTEAQDKTPGDNLSAEARLATKSGLTATRQQDWESALKHFSQAREAAPRSPYCLFNLALANEKAGNRELVAMAWYRAYLAAAPKASNAEQVKSRLVGLEAEIKERIIKFIQIAREAAYGIERPGVKDLALKALAEALTKTGDSDGAGKTADTISQSLIKAEALVLMARSQLETDRMSEGCLSLEKAGTYLKFSLADRNIKPEQWMVSMIQNAYVGALTTAIEALIKAGDITRARTMALAIDAKKYPQDNARAFWKMAEALAIAADIEGARKLANGIELPDWKALAFQEIALAQARSGDIPGALKTVTAITDTADGRYFKALALSMIAPIQVKAGDKAGAGRTQALALESTHPISGTMQVDKVNLYRSIAASQADTGDLPEACRTLSLALETASQIEKETGKAEALANIAWSQAKAFDGPGARKTIGQIKSDTYKTLGLTAIAREQTKTGDQVGARQTLTQALETALKIKPTEEKSFVYQTLAEEQATAGDISGAMQTAKRIQSTHRRYETYKFITKLQLKAGDLAGAKISTKETATALANDEIQFWTKVALERLNRIFTEGRQMNVANLKTNELDQLVSDLATEAGRLTNELNFQRQKTGEWQKRWGELNL